MTNPPPSRQLLTSTGRAVAASALASYLAGWWLGWAEMMILAAGCAMALMLAVPFVIGRHRVSVQRRIEHHLVSAGDEVSATLVIANNGPSPAGPTIVQEQIGAQIIELAVARLGPGEQSAHRIELPTGRRGVVSIGPSRVAKRDPLNLLCRAVARTTVEQLWVRPRVVPLAPIPAGWARDIEGATSDSSPAGDVSFHTLRDYQVGDDPRHVHWLSSARTGTLMVRHYVDNRVPEIAIVLDTRAELWNVPRFDLATEIAASVSVTSTANHVPSSLHLSTYEDVPTGRAGRERPHGHQVGLQELLKALTVVEPRSHRSALVPSLAAEIGSVSRRHPTSSLIVAISGDCNTGEMAAMRRLSGAPPVILVRVGHDEDHSGTDLVPVSPEPGFVVLDIASLEDFRLAWNRQMA